MESFFVNVIPWTELFADLKYENWNWSKNMIKRIIDMKASNKDHRQWMENWLNNSQF